jgi:hypothetical protein
MNNKTSIQLGKLTIVAGEDLPANRFINFSGNLCTSSDKVLGVTTRSYKAGSLACIITHGIVPVESGGAITTIGIDIRPSSDGRASSSPMAFQNIFNLDSASGVGKFIRVKL